MYTGVGRFFDWNNDRLLYQTMQGCVEFDVKFCRDMEYIPMLRFFLDLIARGRWCKGNLVCWKTILLKHYVKVI